MKSRFEFNKVIGFSDFLNALEAVDQLVRIRKSVNPKFELAGIVSKLDKGKAVLFESVKGSSIKVAANVLGTRHRIALSINAQNENMIQERIIDAIRKKSEIHKIDKSN